MTREGFATRWRARRDELARLGAHVDGAKLCDEVLADFEAVITTEDNELITLQGAAERSGYHKDRSEEHTSELQSRLHLVCRLLLEKKKKQKQQGNRTRPTEPPHRREA